MDLEKLMEKLEQDNKILAELDKKMKRLSHSTTSKSNQPLLSTSLPSLVANDRKSATTAADAHSSHLKKPIGPQGTINLNEVSGKLRMIFYPFPEENIFSFPTHK